MPRAWARMPAMYERATSDSPYGFVGIGEGVALLRDRPQALVGVHAGAVDPVDGLGHERRVQPVLLGDGLEGELEGDRVVGGRERVGVLEVDLVLADGDLVVGRLDLDAERLERVDHVLADLLREVGREVEVAGLVVRQRLDRAVLGAAEQEELQLRARVARCSPGSCARSTWRRSTKRGSPTNGSPLGVNTSQMTRAVPRGPDPRCHGISANVSMSGMRYWSLSAMRVKPSIDEPSNQVPCSTDSSSRWIGIVTALTRPMMSVNWSWTKRIPEAWAASILALDSGLLATLDGLLGARRCLSTGRAARGTWAAARGRRRRPSRARRRPSEAPPGPG